MEKRRRERDKGEPTERKGHRMSDGGEQTEVKRQRGEAQTKRGKERGRGKQTWQKRQRGRDKRGERENQR